MSELNEHSESIISKYILGEATPSEIAEAERLIETCDECLKYALGLSKINSAIEENIVKKSVHVDTAIENFIDHARQKKHKSKTVSFARYTKLIIGIAATIIVLLAVWMLNSPQQSELKKYTIANKDDGTTQSDTLDDNSLIVLNAGSSISYVENFGSEHRQIQLEGEAFFEVSHNPELPFQIMTDGVEIIVLGTKFNVTSYKNIDSIIVTVQEGRVKVKKLSSPFDSVIITANQQAVLNKVTSKLNKNQNRNSNFTSWFTHRFVFEQEKLFEISSLLSNVYGVRFDFENEALKDLVLTTEFENQNIDEITKIIALTLNLNIGYKDSTYVFSEQ